MAEADTERQLRVIGEVLERHVLADEGLLTLLRPYRGRIGDEVLDELSDCVEALHWHVAVGADVSMRLVSEVHFLANTMRRWALDPGSMLIRNQLIEPAEQDRLLKWTWGIEDYLGKILGLLGVDGPREVFFDHLVRVSARRLRLTTATVTQDLARPVEVMVDDVLLTFEYPFHSIVEVSEGAREFPALMKRLHHELDLAREQATKLAEVTGDDVLVLWSARGMGIARDG